MDSMTIASMATGMKQVEFQQQVGVAVLQKALDTEKQGGADLALLLNSAGPAGKSVSAPGVGQQLDILG
ncbi:MAG TPA: YjfB family protein [Patescibacteria group bacterium]|nr:YjfB family protein [Patescibacteria group bacterium]